MNPPSRLIVAKKTVAATTPTSRGKRTGITSTNKNDHSFFSDEQQQQPPHGVILNGVWKDYYDVIVAANEKEKLSDEIIGMLNEDRDSLSHERKLLLAQWHHNLSSLTQVETNHLQVQQVLEYVRNEKASLATHCHGLEAQRDWLEQQRLDLRHQEEFHNKIIATLETKIGEYERIVVCEKHENTSLLEITYRRDEMIESLQRKLLRREDDISVLKKSITTKDRQFQILLKERNRLRDELDILDKELKRGRRYPHTKEENPPPLPSPIEIGPTFPHFQHRMTPAVAKLASILSSADRTDGEENDSYDERGDRDRDHRSLHQTSPGTPSSHSNPNLTTPLHTTSMNRSGCSSSGMTDCSTVSFLQSGTTHESSPSSSSSSSVVADLSLLLLGPEGITGTIDMKDKIYRSAIKKLQGELCLAKKTIKTLEEQITTPKRSGGGIFVRKLFSSSPSTRKLF